MGLFLTSGFSSNLYNTFCRGSLPDIMRHQLWWIQIVHTLEQLRNGELNGITRLTLSAELTQFPQEIFNLADSLETLDLSNNQLSELPEDLHRLTKLKILFCSNNHFTHLPSMLANCPNLEMIGFKSNQITCVPASALPEKTRWLILTDNKVSELPEELGQLSRLEKLMLSGNQLTRLPTSLHQCHNLGLIRLSANKLNEFPDVLLDLPKLAWLAFAGNPFCQAPKDEKQIQEITPDTYCINEVLGQGASGVISKATIDSSKLVGSSTLPETVAIKVFKGEVTSDGYPEDELDACLAVGAHPNLVKPLAQVNADYSALIMALIPSHYTNLGQPPSLASCTRDTFTQGQSFSISDIESIVKQMESLVNHFADKGVSHGDLYAHNVLIDSQNHILFGVFGAASRYSTLAEYQQQGIQTIERRAFHYFIEDMLSLCHEKDKETEAYTRLSHQIKR